MPGIYGLRYETGGVGIQRIPSGDLENGLKLEWKNWVLVEQELHLE